MAVMMAPQQGVMIMQQQQQGGYNTSGMPSPKNGAWSTDLLDCCASPGGLGAVCYAMACSPCAYGDMAAIAPANSIMFAGNCCMAGCCFMAMPQLFLCAAHQGLRTAFNIDGSCIGDCFAGCFCPLCALLQQSRECQIRNAAPNGGMQANPMVMVAAPQQVMMQQPVMMVQQPQVVMQPQVMYVR